MSARDRGGKFSRPHDWAQHAKTVFYVEALLSPS